MGGGLPWTDLVVSPQHRIYVNDWRAEMLFGLPEVLVPAKAFVGTPGIEVWADWTGSYFHLLFDHHELIRSNGVISESLHPGEVALSALTRLDRIAVAPTALKREAGPKTTRPSIRVTEGRALISYAA